MLHGLEGARPRRLVQLPRAHQPKPEKHRGERRAKLVRQRRQELVLGPARRLRLGAGRPLAGQQLLALRLAPLSRGDIPDDRDAHAPVAEAHLAERELHGEDRAVLAPSEHLTRAPRRAVGRQQAAGILGGEQAAEVVVDDLGGREAEGPLGRRVE